MYFLLSCKGGTERTADWLLSLSLFSPVFITALTQLQLVQLLIFWGWAKKNILGESSASCSCSLSLYLPLSFPPLDRSLDSWGQLFSWEKFMCVHVENSLEVMLISHMSVLCINTPFELLKCFFSFVLLSFFSFFTFYHKRSLAQYKRVCWNDWAEIVQYSGELTFSS